MKKIIHLSDLHVGYGKCEKKLKKIVTTLLEKYTADSHTVVITGDLVDKATEKGSYKKVRYQLKRLEDAKFTVLPVPGNHDYGTGGMGRKKYVKKFKKAFFDDNKVNYPKVDVDGGVLFIGLDSMAATFDFLDIFGADGELGNKQLKQLNETLKDGQYSGMKKVVYLHHHPFDGRGRLHMLKDYRQLKRVIEDRVDCLLFGHNHDGNHFPDHWGIPLCFDGSSSTGKSEKDGKPATPFRVISLET